MPEKKTGIIKTNSQIRPLDDDDPSQESIKNALNSLQTKTTIVEVADEIIQIVPENSVQQYLLNLTKPRRIKLKDIMYTYIVGQSLMIKERQEVAQIFHVLDLDHDGTISIDEVFTLYKKEFGRPMTELEQKNVREHFIGLSTDSVEFSDFIVQAFDESILSSSDRLATAYRYFDDDGSGAISSKELVEGLNFNDSRRIDETLAKAIMSEIQSDLEELTFKNFILLINHYQS